MTPDPRTSLEQQSDAGEAGSAVVSAPASEPVENGPLDPAGNPDVDDDPAGRFGDLKQDALNRWAVRER